ncbi:MAG: Gfo/Idh/MocA family oxidoreductase [Actinomycetales bacterium]|nr:Gfo/Idh/MocA family oxidoreductase [Actinomycetales bacterium]
MGRPHRVGVVGLGVIWAQYRATLVGHPEVAVTAVADLDEARAHEAAAGIDGARALSTEQLVADEAVDTVLNLTIPAAHASVALAALAHGKNVYGEKPLAATDAEAAAILAARDSAWVGAAPDTVLGTGVQTARAVVDSGELGRPVAASATWLSAGHESWHPNPDFYYRAGGGPLLDMGPYYLTALVHLLGPVERVAAEASRSRAERVIASGPRAGEVIPVEVATHVAGTLVHRGGAISTVQFGFDAPWTTAAPIEVHGERGSMLVPDPNLFAGDVRVRAVDEPDWRLVPPSAGYLDAGRGIGLIDFLRGGGRADGPLAAHVLEIMTGLLASAEDHRAHPVTTTVERPDPVPLTPRAGGWDA